MGEEKILSLILDRLDSIDNHINHLGERIGELEVSQKSLVTGQKVLEKRMSSLENRVEAMAEDVAITRSATNTLLKWTERTEF